MFGSSYFGARSGYGGGSGGAEPAGEDGPCAGVQASQGHGGFIPAEDDNAGPGMQPNAVSGKAASQTLTPVTIRMLLDAAASSGQNGPDSPFRVNGGRELQLLTVVACVEDIKVQEIGICLILDDGTGRIRCNVYPDSDSASGPELQKGDYIRIFGSLGHWDKQEGIRARGMVKIESANEIAHHTIEVAHVHLSVSGKLVRSSASGRADHSSPMPSMPMTALAATHAQPVASTQPAQFAGSHQAQTPTAASRLQHNLAGPVNPGYTSHGGTMPAQITARLQQPSARGGQLEIGIGAQSFHPPPAIHTQRLQPQMQSGYGGVQGGAAQARTSPFQGGLGGHHQPATNMPPPGGALGSSLYNGGSNANSLYGGAAGSGRFR